MNRRSPSSPLRLAGTAGCWILIGAALTALLAAAAPLALGHRSLVVRSGSMSPAIETGDVIVADEIRPADAEPGDVVTFMDPDGSGRMLSHRAVTVEPAGDTVRFTTQGDANDTQEHWNVRVDGSIGRVAYRVPKLGFVTGWIGTPTGRVGLVLIPCLLLGASLLAGIWRQPSDPEGLDETT